MQETSPWPTELRVTDEGRVLRISFDDGSSHELSAEYLRVESPSAEVQGHGPGQRVTQYGKRKVTIKQIQPTGNYAVRIQFSDGHYERVPQTGHSAQQALMALHGAVI